MKILPICLERQKMKIAVISVTTAGDKISDEIKKYFSVDLYSKNNVEGFKLKDAAKKAMSNYKAVVFISSTGIAVRAISSYIKSKDKDPAVIVIDSSCKFVISLLSGHLGGANELTCKLASILKAVPVITTATDNIGVKAPDVFAKENGLLINDLKDAKYIAALLVEGKKVGFIDEDKLLDVPKGYSSNLDNIEGLLYITNKYKVSEENFKSIKTLKLIRKNVVLGIGCRKNFDSKQMIETVKKLLLDYNIDERAVKIVTSYDIKREEKAIIELAKFLKAQFKTFTKEDIKSVEHKYKGSNFVEERVGVKAVCEPCVELARGKILVNKLNLSGMTLCIGKEIYNAR